MNKHKLKIQPHEYGPFDLKGEDHERLVHFVCIKPGCGKFLTMERWVIFDWLVNRDLQMSYPNERLRKWGNCRGRL